MTIYVVIAVWCGCFDHAKAFDSVEKAEKYLEDLEKASPNHSKYDLTKVSLDID